MRIGIVSDTHGDSYAIRRVIEQAGRVDAWIHLGDNTRDAEAFGKDGTPVYSVAGNCDFGGEKELRISLDGAEIFATHGQYYGSLTVRRSLAATLRCTATHISRSWTMTVSCT